MGLPRMPPRASPGGRTTERGPWSQSTLARCSAVLWVASILLIAAGCQRSPNRVPWEGSGPAILKPLAQVEEYRPAVRKIVYVPIYSSIYWGFDQQLLELAVTLSIRNVSLQDALVIHSAKYYDSEGRELADFVERPSELGTMATADFVIPRSDTTGGPGANVLVEWSSSEIVDEPVIEAVMIGSHGNVGVSFKSEGRTLSKASSLASAAPAQE